MTLISCILHEVSHCRSHLRRRLHPPATCIELNANDGYTSFSEIYKNNKKADHRGRLFYLFSTAENFPSFCSVLNTVFGIYVEFVKIYRKIKYRLTKYMYYAIIEIESSYIVDSFSALVLDTVLE